MELSKFEPGKALRTLRSEVNSLFDRFVERPIGTIMGQVVPTLDISETDTELTITADLPGMNEEDLDVNISGQTLTIRGQKKQEREESGKSYHLVERSYGGFSRSVHLPVAVDADQIKATYKKGVLEIVLPKTEPSQAKKIKIQAE